MQSIEGERGMPRLRPPFPAESGLWRRPTNINNVETLAVVPWIITNGAEAFASRGYEKSKGKYQGVRFGEARSIAPASAEGPHGHDSARSGLRHRRGSQERQTVQSGAVGGPPVAACPNRSSISPSTMRPSTRPGPSSAPGE